MLIGQYFKNLDLKFKNHYFSGLSFNSQSCKKDNIFFAVKGTNLNGNKFIHDALQKGAKTIVSDQKFKGFKKGVLYLRHRNVRKLLAETAYKIFNKKPKNLIAITGTNGKSSIANFYFQILKLNKKKVASIGTLGIQTNTNNIAASNTTLDPVQLGIQLKKLKEKNIDNVILEASSHGLKQNRLDGLEFKIYRHDVKELLVKLLNNVPEFYNEITISGESEHLPACLLTDSVEVPGDYNDIGTFQPAALLGLFYEMDGSLEDAKKCFKIQTEVSSDFKTDNGSQKDYWQNRIEEIDQQIRMGKQKSLIEKQTDEESKKPRTSQHEQDQFSLQAVISKTYDFELDDLRRYAFDKITKNDMKAILKKTPWYDKTLIDKVREMQAKEENDTILPLDPTDWDYLDLFDKIKILNPYINRNIKDYLQTIRRHRNITSHPKRYKKQDLEQRNKMIMLYIQECKDFFEKSEQR